MNNSDKRFHLYADEQGRVIAIENDPDAIDEAQGLMLVRRLLRDTVRIEQASILLEASGGQFVYAREAA